jgi:hypothetical protein
MSAPGARTSSRRLAATPTKLAASVPKKSTAHQRASLQTPERRKIAAARGKRGLFGDEIALDVRRQGQA